MKFQRLSDLRPAHGLVRTTAQVAIVAGAFALGACQNWTGKSEKPAPEGTKQEQPAPGTGAGSSITNPEEDKAPEAGTGTGSSAATPEEKTPEEQTPEEQTPEEQTPEEQAPEAQAPEQAPEAQAPKQAPEEQAPDASGQGSQEGPTPRPITPQP